MWSPARKRRRQARAQRPRARAVAIEAAGDFMNRVAQ